MITQHHDKTFCGQVDGGERTVPTFWQKQSTGRGQDCHHIHRGMHGERTALTFPQNDQQVEGWSATTYTGG